MSTYRRLTKIDGMDAFKPAWWLDDYYGSHQYGFKFDDDATVYNPNFVEYEAEEWRTDSLAEIDFRHAPDPSKIKNSEKFTTKDSGKTEKFDTGSQRDTEEGKTRYYLVSQPALKRIANLMTRGADKYGVRNWEKGMPNDRLISSGLRHFYQFIEGDTSEDHLAAVCFNLMAIMHFEEVK